MDNVLVQSEYVLSLYQNTVTEELRNNYFALVNNEDLALESFALLLSTFLHQIADQNLSTVEAFNLMQNEYINSTLPDYLFNFNNYSDLVYLIFTTKENKLNGKITIEFLQNYINIADNVKNDRVKISIYCAVLQILLHSNLIVENINFTKKVMTQIKDYGLIPNPERRMQDVILQALTIN